MRFGKVTRPVLGIKFAPDQSVEQLGVSGVLVLDAPANGPAGKAVILHTVSCILFVKLFLLQLARNMDSLTIYNFIYVSVEFLFFFLFFNNNIIIFRRPSIVTTMIKGNVYTI